MEDLENTVPTPSLPDTDEERLKLVQLGFCIIAGEVVPEGKTKCIAGMNYRCIFGAATYIGKCAS